MNAAESIIQQKAAIAEAKMKNRARSLTTEALCEVWEVMRKDLLKNPNYREIVIVSEFLSNELQSRNPEAWERWIDTEEIDLIERPSFFFLPQE